MLGNGEGGQLGDGVAFPATAYSATTPVDVIGFDRPGAHTRRAAAQPAHGDTSDDCGWLEKFATVGRQMPIRLLDAHPAALAGGIDRQPL